MQRPGLIRIGKPLDFSRYAGAGNDREVLRWITDEIMDAVMQLSGQTYVDAYGASVKDGPAEGRELPARRPATGRGDGPSGAAGAGAARIASTRTRSSGTIDDHERRAGRRRPAARPASRRRRQGHLLGVEERRARPGGRQFFRPIEEGAENVPETGAAIVASNHLSFADWLFMPLALDRRVTFVAKSDYFTGAGIKGWAQKRFFAGTGQVPDRPQRRPGQRRRPAGRPQGPAARRAVRHLSRRHPQPRRPAVQGPHRRRPAGPAGRACRSSRPPSSAPT